MGLIPGGLLMERLTLLENTPQDNGAGGWTDSWAAVAEVNGRITMASTRETERIIVDQPRGAELVEITLDATVVTVKGEQRVRAHDGTEYEVLRVRRQGPLAMLVGRKV